MAGNLASRNHLPMSEINVTPLVDVMLVLLIIFMITAPHLEQGIAVQLPEVTAAPFPVETKELVITITADEKVFLDHTQVPLARLEPVLKEVMKSRSGNQVYLRADKGVPYGVVVKVMAEARKAGIENLGLVTEPEKIKSPQP